MIKIEDEFELELRHRGVEFFFDESIDCYQITLGQTVVSVSIDNLKRKLARAASEDVPTHIRDFIDVIVKRNYESTSIHLENIYWSLEAKEFSFENMISFDVSECVHAVLVHISEDFSSIRYLESEILDDIKLNFEEVSELAYKNLARQLLNAKLAYEDIDDVRLGFMETIFPLKASLILSPQFQKMAQLQMQLPLLAVIPSRDFLYFWSKEQFDLVSRLGSVVVEEYQQSPYPISTEVYELSDVGVKPLGMIS